MKKSLVIVAFLCLIGLAGCSISGLKPFGGSGDVGGDMGGLVTLSIEIEEPVRGTIDIDPLAIVSANFRITDSAAGVQTTNWIPGAATLIRFNPIPSGSTTLRLIDVDASGFAVTNTKIQSFTSGYNYRIRVSLGGAIYLIETNYAGSLAWRYNMIYSESHADTNVWARGASLYIWSPSTTIAEITTAPYEGTYTWRLTRAASVANWMGFGIDITNATARDYTLYQNGALRFSVKHSNITNRFKVGLKSVVGTTTNEAWVMLTNIPGWAPDGTWKALTVPMSAFSGVNFSGLTGVFYFSTDTPIPNAQTNVATIVDIDDVYLERM